MVSPMPNRSVSDITKILAGRPDILQPEYAPVKNCVVLFGLPRSELWRLMDEGLITWYHYRRPGAEKGLRLIELASLRKYIRTFAKP